MTECVPLITPQDCGTTPVAPPSVAPVPEPPPTSDVVVNSVAPQTPSPDKFENSTLPNGWHAPNWQLHISSVTDVLAWLGTLLLGLGFLVGLAVAMVWVAHWRRWDARQVRNYALGALVLPLGAMAVANSWFAAPALWWQGTQVFAHSGPGSGAMVAMTAGCLPLAWGAAAVYRSRFLSRLGTEGVDAPWKTRRLLRRQQHGQAAAARRAAKYGAPLTTGWLKNRVVLGPLSEKTDATQPTTITQLVSKRSAKLEIPIENLGHMIVLGKSQMAGKTTMQVRLGTALYEAYWHRYVRTGEKRPLLINLDCKGGKAGLATGRQVVKIAHRLGVQPSRIALWPITSRFDIWDMDEDDQTATLESMINPVQATDAGAEHFKQNRIRVVQLATKAPGGKSKSRDDFLQRLTVDWLTKAYAGNPAILAEIADLQQNKPPAIGDVAGKFRNIFNAIGEGFDGGRPLDSFDVIYATVPGTVRGEYARAQVAAITTLISQFACSDHDRQIILIIDEMSAVSDKTGGINQFTIAERLLGMGVIGIFSAQNQYGLGQTQDERRRLMEACPSGALLMNLEGAGKVSEVFGTRPVTENSRHSKGGKVGDEGTLGNRETFFIDPNRLAEFKRGDVVWVHALKAQWGHVVPVELDEITELPADPFPERWATTQPRVPLRAVRDLDSGRARRADFGGDGEGGEVA
ncbi:hypothetical protein KP696_19065 [Nocardia seriolae]|uniref:TraD/TraG TraM recognition site domain-containing protein n=1 Tax=Nocardia seriolae TaxID=37332 RepID=A0ABC9YLD1_9NOCA|nr:hypothetical protein [Nocardia seriolae]APB01709.1 hypothetical protein NS506_07690 [Nocardia seriolae]MTJ60823.1 hypothetical protein [Nocardia seriolae]MTJ91035.1 hypothetical protein [Nocardia seriolae]MTK51613.1 hypothetical protein [Nocardia seriolae]RLP24130.1 hypothetical protein D6158_33965 [Nocardia seriolae]